LTVVDRVVALEPDFVLHTGDLVALGSGYRYWETFFEIERELMARIPLFPTLGNHECNHSYYFDFFYLPGNERWYAFDYGNARFLCLQVDGIADFSERAVCLAGGGAYIVTGGGGAPLCVMKEREPTRVAFAVAYHVVLLEIDGNRLEATVFSNKGRVLDEFERAHP
jgi:hypothetical protein